MTSIDMTKTVMNENQSNFRVPVETNQYSKLTEAYSQTLAIYKNDKTVNDGILTTKMDI